MIPLGPFILFAVVTSITPGPNNVMIAASAAAHGARAVMPLVMGIAFGFAAMILIVGLGLAVPLAAAPTLRVALRRIATAWLVWLAWKIASAAPPGMGQARPPLGFLGGALFQWVNPKAWMLAFSVATAWTTPSGSVAAQIAAMAAIFFVVCTPCCALWAAAGAQAGRWLGSPGRLRTFNVSMAVLLVLSMVPVVVGE